MAQRTILWSPYQGTRTHVVLYVDCENKDGNVSYEHILCSVVWMVCIIFCADYIYVGTIYVLRIPCTVRTYIWIYQIVPIYKVPTYYIWISH